MKARSFFGMSLGLFAVLAAGVIAARDGESAQQAKGNNKQATKSGATPDREREKEAIVKQARDFIQAFGKEDAKAIAAAWTDQAEYHEEGGEVIRGRAAIEQAYADFFKEHPKCQVEVQIKSIRFLSRDTAVEDGFLLLKYPGPELPTSTRYDVLHVREDGQWKIAFVWEWGADDDKLHDLAWLIGDWVSQTKDGEVKLSFEWNEKKTSIQNNFLAKEGDQVKASGTQRISLEPQTGQLHSWLFNDDGSHGQAVWSRDGNSWIIDSAGVLNNGSETVSVNVLTRLSGNEFLWRSINRAIDNQALPHTDPVKLTRVKAAK